MSITKVYIMKIFKTIKLNYFYFNIFEIRYIYNIIQLLWRGYRLYILYYRVDILIHIDSTHTCTTFAYSKRRLLT